jgi:hypothetical protein
MISQHQQEKMMSLPTNNDVANRELSIDELETIAGGGLLGWFEDGAKSVVHGIEHAANAVENWFTPDIKITFTFGRPRAAHLTRCPEDSSHGLSPGFLDPGVFHHGKMPLSVAG